jgi:TPR repeat protein
MVSSMDIPDLRRKAEAGSVVAQSILGICYLHGINVEADCREAFRLLSAAAAKGASRAQLNLGHMYFEGMGIPPDVPQALRLYHAAAEKGEFDAQIQLGRIYSRGTGASIDFDAALRWYTFALSQRTRVRADDEIEEAREFVERWTSQRSESQNEDGT